MFDKWRQAFANSIAKRTKAVLDTKNVLQGVESIGERLDVLEGRLVRAKLSDQRVLPFLADER